MVVADVKVSTPQPDILSVDPVHLIQVAAVIAVLGFLLYTIWNFFAAASKLLYEVIMLGILGYVAVYLLSSLSFMPDNVRELEFGQRFSWIADWLSSRFGFKTLVALLRKAEILGGL